LILSGDWNDSRLPYNMPGHAVGSGTRDMPTSSHAASNMVDNDSFLGHEVGMWKGSEASWRGDDLNRTLTPQPVYNGPALEEGMPPEQGSFRIVDSDLSFTASDRNWKAPGRDEQFASSRDPLEYDSSRPRDFADMRPSNGNALAAAEVRDPLGMPNGTGVDRYPAIPVLHEGRPWSGAAGLDVTFLRYWLQNGLKYCFLHGSGLFRLPCVQ